MKQASTFVLLFIVLVFVVARFKVKENFQNPSLRIPNTKVPQRNLVHSSKEEEYAPTSTSMAGPAPGTIASVNTLPYKDPSNESVKYQRLLNVQTTLKGFLENEAPNIQEISDPSIQLPLTSAHSDLNRLTNEILVLKRNPGINSSISQKDLDEIQANLSWLQHKYRQSIYNETALNEIEGFQDISGSDIDNSVLDIDNSGNNIDSNLNSNVISSVPVTKRDLMDLVVRIDTKISNLSSSGTTDVTVMARIENLRKVKQKINDMVSDLNNNRISEKDIKITKKSMDEFLKMVDEEENGSSAFSFLSDLLFNKDKTQIANNEHKQKQYEKYVDTLFKGLSWNLNLTYTSPNQFALANTYLNNNNNQQLWNSMNNGYFNDVVYSANSNIDFNKPVYNQQQNQVYNQVYNQSNTPVKDNYEKRFERKENKHAVFDWHERANFICQAIQKRGMNPKDYGCLDNDEYVSENFSWRGYAKMICTRLGTSYDTGLPETCGCPPATWAGWKP